MTTAPLSLVSLSQEHQTQIQGIESTHNIVMIVTLIVVLHFFFSVGMTFIAGRKIKKDARNVCFKPNCKDRQL